MKRTRAHPGVSVCCFITEKVYKLTSARDCSSFRFTQNYKRLNSALVGCVPCQKDCGYFLTYYKDI